MSKFRIKNRLWLESENGTFLAEGRVDLLKNIIELGSISKAAKKMNMSYKKAWDLVNSINLESKEPIVIKNAGGALGGGAEITLYGIKMIKIYDLLNKKCQNLLQKELEKIEF